jgi:hypothetical protein
MLLLAASFGFGTIFMQALERCGSRTRQANAETRPQKTGGTGTDGDEEVGKLSLVGAP